MPKGRFFIVAVCLLLPLSVRAGVPASVLKESGKAAASSLGKLVKLKGVGSRLLSKTEFDELAKLLEQPGGVKAVGERIGQMQLSQAAREQAYLSLAVRFKRIDDSSAQVLKQRLGGVEGFAPTLRKLLGNNPKGTAGHLYELQMGSAAVGEGFKVLAIGRKFDDGMKKALTDVDLLLERNGRMIAIEAKDYARGTPIPMDKFRADMDSLNAFRKLQSTPVIPVFSIRRKPDDSAALKRLLQAAESRGVQLIVGEPTGQMEKIRLLQELL